MFEIKQIFKGTEKFTLPALQSQQYLKIFPSAETDDHGMVIARIPAEWSVKGKGINGNIMEHPNGFSWFVQVYKYPNTPGDNSCRLVSGITKTFDEAVEMMKKEIICYRGGRCES